MLFDFNFAARIQHPSPGEREVYLEDRDDIKGLVFTIYEIITRETTLFVIGLMKSRALMTSDVSGRGTQKSSSTIPSRPIGLRCKNGGSIGHVA